MSRIRKVRIFVLDDEVASAAARAAAFYDLTTASLSPSVAVSVTDQLAKTRSCDGVEIVYLEPSALLDLPAPELTHGVALIDVNWHSYSGADPLLAELTESQRKEFGITLAKFIVGKRPPESHFHLILYSATRGNRVADAYSEWVMEKVPFVWQAVTGEGEADMPAIRRYSQRIYDSICRDLLAHASPAVCEEVHRARLEFEKHRALLRPTHLVGAAGSELVAGYRLADLAAPYYLRFVREQSRLADAALREAGTRVLSEWTSNFTRDVVEFEFDDQVDSLTVAFVKAVLRYPKVDHLDSLLYFRGAQRSRFYNPAQFVKDRVAGGCASPDELSLRYAFARIPQIKLGTEMDRDPDKHAGIPRALRDRSGLDVARRARRATPLPRILITRTSEDPFAFTAELAPATQIRNRLWTVREYCANRAAEGMDASKAAECFRLDPENLDLLERLAADPVEAMNAIGLLDIRPHFLATHFRRGAESLRGACAALTELRETVFGLDQAVPIRVRRALALDLLHADEKLSAWSRRAQHFEDAAEMIGESTEKDSSLASYLARFRKAETHQEKYAIFAGPLKDVAHSAKRTAASALRKRTARFGLERSEADRRVSAELKRLFPPADETAQAHALADLLDLATSQWDSSLATRLGADLAAEVRRRMADQLVKDVEAEVLVGLSHSLDRGQDDNEHANPISVAPAALQELSSGEDLIQQTIRWLLPACPGYTREDLHAAVAEINDTCGTVHAWGLEQCFFPNGIPANLRPWLPPEARARLQRELAELGVDVDPIQFAGLFA
jgi:hypothetical protein